MELRLVYMTAGTRAEAEVIGRTLIEKRLAACVNIIGGMTSIYRWKGEMQTTDEAMIIAKTEESKLDALILEMKMHHSYEVPAALAVPVLGGDPAYIDWLKTCLAEA